MVVLVVAVVVGWRVEEEVEEDEGELVEWWLWRRLTVKSMAVGVGILGGDQ